MSDKVIFIGADIVPTKTNAEYFKLGDAEYLVGKELLAVLDDADYTIMNLETPLTDTTSEIVKCGPCLCAGTDTIKGLKRINPHFYTLANNHIFDQDVQGLNSTIKCLRENGISFAGVGETPEEASKPFITNLDGIKIGIYCCAEHEFSIVTDNRPGANPYDPLYSFDHVRALREQVDILIVLYHGGKEHYRYPSPELRRIFRKFAECGADYVIAQHTHCIGCMEQYLGKTLVYGQGNFLFDNSNSDYWKTSILLKIIIKDPINYRLEIIPLIKKEERVELATGQEKQKILSELEKRNNNLSEPNFVENMYAQYAEQMRKEYFIRLLGKWGKNPLIRILNKITSYRFLDSIYTDAYLPVVENCFDCEAHRELAAQVTKRYMVNKK